MHGSHLALDTRSQLIAVMLLYKGGTCRVGSGLDMSTPIRIR